MRPDAAKSTTSAANFVASKSSAGEKRPPSNGRCRAVRRIACIECRATQYRLSQNCDKLADFIVSCSIAAALQHYSGVSPADRAYMRAASKADLEVTMSGKIIPAARGGSPVRVHRLGVRPGSVRRKLRLRSRPVPEPCRPERHSSSVRAVQRVLQYGAHRPVPLRVGAAETRSARKRGCAVTSQQNFAKQRPRHARPLPFSRAAPRTAHGNAEARSAGATACTNLRQPRCPRAKPRLRHALTLHRRPSRSDTNASKETVELAGSCRREPAQRC